MTAAKSALRFLSRDAVVVLHRESLSEHGGIDGIRDEGLLQSALHRCVHKSNYEPDASVIALAASLAFGLAMNHAFNDGNERTAMIATFVFLEMNGYVVEAPELEAYTMFIGLAAGEVGEAELAARLADLCA
jgi:death-on-curing protein